MSRDEEERVVSILVIFYWGWKEDGKDRRDTNWSEGE